MEKETIEEKQKYLRENIIEKGYNPDKFLEFLSSKKGESGTKLENWTIQELMDATQEFIKNNQIQIGINFEQNKENFSLIIDKAEKNGSQEDSYISCVLIEETPISKQNFIEIKVSEPQVEKGGIFTFSYSTYLIKTSPLNLEVRRRYNDFFWLYNILKTQFVNCIVPPFFRKEKIDKIQTNNRIYFIEQFLNNISIHPLLRNSKIFYDFISIKNEKDYNDIKVKYEKLVPPNNAKNIKTLNGEVKVTITSDSEKYYQNIKEKFNSQEVIFDKILYNYKNLLYSIQQTSEKMKEISKNWKELYNLKDEYFESECTSGTYDALSRMMQEWSELQNKYCTCMKNSITRFIRYVKEEIKSFKDLYYIVDSNRNYYYKKKQKLLYAKEQLIKEKEKIVNNIKNESDVIIEDVKKKEIEFSKLMINDTDKFLELEKEYGCYLNCYINEYERLRDLQSSRMKKNSFNFVKEIGIQISNFNFSLGEILAFIDTLTEEGYVANPNINNEICNNAVPVAGKQV